MAYTPHNRLRAQMTEVLLEQGPLTSADLMLKMKERKIPYLSKGFEQRNQKMIPTHQEISCVLAKHSEFRKVGRIKVLGVNDNSYWVVIWGAV